MSLRRCSGGAGLMACACVPRPRPALSVVGGWVGRGLSGRAGWSLALACLPGGGAGWCLAPPSFGGLGGVAGLCAGFGAPPSPLLKYYLRRGLPSCGLVPWAGLGAFASAWPSVRPLLGRGLCVVGELVRCRGLCLWCLRVGGVWGFCRPPPPSARSARSACPRTKCGARSAEGRPGLRGAGASPGRWHIAGLGGPRRPCGRQWYTEGAEDGENERRPERPRREALPPARGLVPCATSFAIDP